MTNEERMLQMILSDERLIKNYGYDPSDYVGIDDALNAEEPIVVAIAMIIQNLHGSTDKSVQQHVYKSVFQYLNNNLLT